MTKEEYYTKQAAGEVVLVDIREAQELAVLPSPALAVHLPLSRFSEQAIQDLPKEKLIVTLCQSGGRCQLANQFLSGHGYQVDLIEGGMNRWGGTG